MLEIRLGAVTHQVALRILLLRSFANSHICNRCMKRGSDCFPYRLVLNRCLSSLDIPYEAASWIFLYAALTSSVSPYFFNHFETIG